MTATPNAILSYATPTACEFCKRPLGEAFYRIKGKIACANCAGQVAGLMERNRFAVGPWFMGALAGLITAIACGFLWALIVKVTNYKLGIVAAAVGIIVSKAVIWAAGKRRGPSIQLLAIVFSIIGIVVGEGLTASWAMWDQIRAEMHVTPERETMMRVVVFFIAPVVGFTAFDLLWYGIAIWEAWRIPRAIRLPIEGPFAAQPAGAPPHAPLQFDRVEPAPAPVPAPAPSPPSEP